MKLFISGWAGFKEALDVPEEWHFINPFLDLDEEGILNFLKDKSGETVIGWSTGGHIILKNLQFFSERFKEIVIVAGFKKFTDYVNPRVIKRMIQKMAVQPEEVINEFLINAGCNPSFPKEIDYTKLIQGLDFLLLSEVLNTYSDAKNMTLIQGTEDKILSIKALKDLEKDYPFARTFLLNKPHWITFQEIRKIKASGVS